MILWTLALLWFLLFYNQWGSDCVCGDMDVIDFLRKMLFIFRKIKELKSTIFEFSDVKLIKQTSNLYPTTFNHDDLMWILIFIMFYLHESRNSKQTFKNVTNYN